MTEVEAIFFLPRKIASSVLTWTLMSGKAGRFDDESH